MTPLTPLTRDLVLIGGGHAHALVLRMWGMNPMAGVRLTVINPAPSAPYTGMLPGFIAGHYSRDQLNIDLVKLCRFAGARLVIGHADGIDVLRKTVSIEGRPDIGYDVASVDIGIHLAMPEINGFTDHGIAAKPLDVFADRWTELCDGVDARSTAAAVIGGGIAGVELALAMKHRLGDSAQVSLIERAASLTGVTGTTKRRLEQALTRARIKCLFGAEVTTVRKDHILVGDQEIASDFTTGAAGAKPHAWVAATDLALQNGYIPVDETLASITDPDIFAAGDCAHLTTSPRPKAGVFAVRAAPVLLHNLKARLSGGAAKPFKPQSTYLKLISLGRKSAIAEKGVFSFSADWMWGWKDRIDQKFMEQFRSLPQMPAPALPSERSIGVAEALADKPLCGGCGAKVGPGVLHDALCGLADVQRTDVVSELGDDAAVIKIGGRKQVISVDHLRAFDLDPWRMARIAAVHALGDIWAMGAEPQSVLVSLILPRMSNDLQKRTLSEIMAGVQSIAQAAGADIVGGHTSQGAELTIGLTATGLLPKNTEAKTLTGACVDDALILTRPIGSGTILAAKMAGQSRGEDVTKLLTHLQQPQAKAAAILSDAHAMTDVTGFGLGGHLLAMCKASGVGAELDMQDVPVFDGALDLSKAGHHSSIFSDNAAIGDHFSGLDCDKGDLLFDPQTSGGLLAAVDRKDASDLLGQLTEAGYPAAIIGRVTGQRERIICR
jgi:selenide,water dikinase